MIVCLYQRMNTDTLQTYRHNPWRSVHSNLIFTDPCHPCANLGTKRRSRFAFVTTVTELNAIAAPARARVPVDGELTLMLAMGAFPVAGLVIAAREPRNAIGSSVSLTA